MTGDVERIVSLGVSHTQRWGESGYGIGRTYSESVSGLNGEAPSARVRTH
jgi:hypothetical protein